MDAVPGGADNFRHIGPDGVKAGAFKRAAVTGAGYGNAAGFRLIPGGADDFFRPVGVTQKFVFRVRRFGN